MKYKRTITKLFNDKYASIKDYEVKKAIELGGAEITLQPNNKKMFLSVDQLKQGLQKGESEFVVCLDDAIVKLIPEDYEDYKAHYEAVNE